jgi:hypothetical protein
VAEQPAPAPRAGIVDERQEQVLADIRASLAARDLEYAKAVDPEACALLVRLAAEYGFELSFLASGENFTARLTDTRPPNGGSRPVLHFQSWNAYWSGDPGGLALDVSEVGAWLAAYRAHPAWHPDSLYDDMKARMRSAEAPGPGKTTPRHAQVIPTSSADTEPASLDDLGLTHPAWQSDTEEYANKEMTRPADPEVDPCTVTGHFVTSIGPTLHYTLTSTAGHVLDYWREPDGNVGVQIKVGNRWMDLATQDPRYQAVIDGVREHEARNPDLAGYNNPQAASAGQPADGDAPGEGPVPVPAATGPRAPGMNTEPIRHLDPRSQEARLAGWDSAEDYLTAQAYADELAGLPSYGSDEQQAAADALSAFKALQSPASRSALHEAVSAVREARTPPAPGSSSPYAAGPGDPAGTELPSALQRRLAPGADPDAPGAAPRRAGSAALRLAGGQEFTDAPGAPLAAGPGRRPAGTTPSPAKQARPRGRQ